MEIESQQKLGWDDLLEKDQCRVKVNLEDLLETTSGKRQEYWLVAMQAAWEASRLQGQLQANAHRQGTTTRESLHTPLVADCCVISLSPRHHCCCLHNFCRRPVAFALHPHRHPPVAWSDPPLIRVVINPAATTYCGRLLFFLVVTLLLVPPPIVQICRQPRDPPLVIYHRRRKAATTLTRMKTTKELKAAHLGGGPMPPD